MSFSTALRLDDINDYIAPAQSCIKPIKIDKSSNKTRTLKIDGDGFVSTETGETYTKATISLNDCLACSGCITTAESVLVKQHSTSVFTDFLAKHNSAKLTDRQVLIVSLSPQSLASLTATLLSDTDNSEKISTCFETWKRHSPVDASLSDIDIVLRFIVHHLKLNCVHFVTDVTWARDLSLYAAVDEFVARFACKLKDESLHCPPIFTGICPGWVCYAEKAHGGDASSAAGSFSLIQYLSKICSPQQLIGRLCKQQFNRRIYHVTVMPCFDKKLEASRQEFAQSHSCGDGESDLVPDIDLVLATNEFLEVLNLTALSANKYTGKLVSEPTALDDAMRLHLERLNTWIWSSETPIDSTTSTPLPPMYRHAGSGSGGYAVTVFTSAAFRLFDISLPDGNPTDDDRVIVRYLQNRDMQEMLLFRTSTDRSAAQDMLSKLPTSRTPYRHLKHTGPVALLAFAIANGFRNIQTVVQPLRNFFRKQRRLATASSVSSGAATSSLNYPFDYVEVMACPGGCLNGGGQLKSSSLDDVARFYATLPVKPVLSTYTAQQMYAAMDAQDPEHRNFDTEYREVPHTEIINPAALQW